MTERKLDTESLIDTDALREAGIDPDDVIKAMNGIETPEKDDHELTVEITTETDDAVADLREVRDTADEAREAIEALEESVRSLGKTTSNPQKDMDEMRESFSGWADMFK